MIHAHVSNHIYTSINVSRKYNIVFRKSFNVEYFLITTLEKWYRPADASGATGTLLRDPPKAFYSIELEVSNIPCISLICIKTNNQNKFLMQYLSFIYWN